MENLEIWKTIDGYENYQVSNLGNVKNLKTNRILKKGNSRSYICQTLSKENNPKTFKTHRLIAFAFIINKFNKPYINHINGIKTDNRVENLEWCTHSENMKHADLTGLRKMGKGEKSCNVKLSEKDILDIRNSNLTQRQLAKNYNIHFATISSIILKKSWKHI